MIADNQFPLTVYRGKSYQREYRGMDIVIVISSGRGIDCIIMNNGHLFWKDHRVYMKVDEYFEVAEKHIDYMLEGGTDLRLQQMEKRLSGLKEKAKRQAKKALMSALSFGAGNGKKAFIEYFENELDKEIERI